MSTKMPYLSEDEIVINGKTVNANATVDDADESFFENKVGKGTRREDIFICLWCSVVCTSMRCVGLSIFIL